MEGSLEHLSPEEKLEAERLARIAEQAEQRALERKRLKELSEKPSNSLHVSSIPRNLDDVNSSADKVQSVSEIDGLVTSADIFSRNRSAHATTGGNSDYLTTERNWGVGSNNKPSFNNSGFHNNSNSTDKITPVVSSNSMSSVINRFSRPDMGKSIPKNRVLSSIIRTVAGAGSTIPTNPVSSSIPVVASIPSSVSTSKVQSNVAKMPPTNQTNKKVSSVPQSFKSRSRVDYDWSTTEDTFSSNDFLYSAPLSLAGKGTSSKDLVLPSSKKRTREVSSSSQSTPGSSRPAESPWKSLPASKMEEKHWRMMCRELQLFVRPWLGSSHPSGFSMTPKKLDDSQPVSMDGMSLLASTQNVPMRLSKALFEDPLLRPLLSWTESFLPAPLVDTLYTLKLNTPTPIQRAAVPAGLAGRNILAVAETGSGKTLAFLLPLLTFIATVDADSRRNTSRDGPLAVILAPTRELAQQIETEIQKFSKAFRRGSKSESNKGPYSDYSEQDITSTCLVGGVSLEAQLQRLSMGVDIVVGTPGRMIDCLEKTVLVLNQCKWIVLDEADRMIDTGFEQQVQQVLDAMGLGVSEDTIQSRAMQLVYKRGMRYWLKYEESEKLATEASVQQTHGKTTIRSKQHNYADTDDSSVDEGDENHLTESNTSNQARIDPPSVPQSETTKVEVHNHDEDEDDEIDSMSMPPVVHLFTATMPPRIEELTRRYLRNPVCVRIGDPQRSQNRRIQQEVLLVGSEREKKDLFRRTLRTLPQPMIVFVNMKANCDAVAREVESAGLKASVLVSSKSQDQREAALQAFRAGRTGVLVCTDVAGRGLDIPDVQQVVNFDMAPDIERYTHRIGRTGRAGKSGRALTFLNKAEDAPVAADLLKYLKNTEQNVPVELSKFVGAGFDMILE